MKRINGMFVGEIPTADELVEAHGGNLQAAEAEAWEAWEYDGKKEHSPYKFLAIAVADKKWVKVEVK